jgi:predicted Ser/Thr protein kinase
MESIDLKELLAGQKKRSLHFTEFIADVIESPDDYLHTSSSLISDAIKYFGFEIVVRSGEPIISYNIFKDLFSTGINAVFGQEHCIKHIVDVIESFDNEASLNRGIVLVGPPASGKTNVVDLIVRALEEYTKQRSVKLYTFYFCFSNDKGRYIEIRSQFHHHPILLIPITMQGPEGFIVQPRKQLFDHIKGRKDKGEEVLIPNFYLNATLDKRTLDILEALRQNPRNKNKSLYDVLEEYVRIEEIEFSTSQAKGISNIDDTGYLRARVNPIILDAENTAILNEHMLGKILYRYDGAIVDSNRGILHIHDAFGLDDGSKERDYKPLLMLLGSGKVSVESTQASVDNTVVITTNIEEMKNLDKKLDSSKLLDRIERVPVNYLLDANSEMDILRRDMSNMRDQYDVDPNLLRTAAYYSVLTRLLPPVRKNLPEKWSDEKKNLYHSISPEQKLYIYAAHSDDPIQTIQELPHWHPFHNEMMRMGMNSYDAKSFSRYIVAHPRAIHLGESNLFTNEQLDLIDNEFMRTLWNEHFPNEGISGISVRQLQNIMRNTIVHSDGRKIHVGIFLKQLSRIIDEGPELHHWLATDENIKRERPPVPYMRYGYMTEERDVEGVGNYGHFRNLVDVVRNLYYNILKNEITVCTVDRDPLQIEMDLRRYVQYALLNSAIKNTAFSHIMVPKFSFVDPQTGEKVEKPDLNFMQVIEAIIDPDNKGEMTREEMAQKFLNCQSTNELKLEDEKSVIASSVDTFLQCFTHEYRSLLSHRKVDESINPEQLRNAFFHMSNTPERMTQYHPSIHEIISNILSNMHRLYAYSEDIALDTIVFALRKEIIQFEEILR